MKRAFITGITGQDGSYLAELLLELGYEVHGLIRRHSSPSTARIDHLFDRLHLHYGDLVDGSNLARLLNEIKPDEVYNLGAQSHVRVSFDCPEYTCDADALGTIRLLEAIRQAGLTKSVRYYQASSSEMFGGINCPEEGYTESSPFHPMSPYGCAKVFSFHAAVNYRESYGMFCSNGILFNHESPRRGETFVTRKITRALARIRHGLQDTLTLGNLGACRDWGHAEDYVYAMWLMLQQPIPTDYVIATGETHSVHDFLEIAADYFHFTEAEMVKLLRFDSRYLRPSEVPFLKGNPSKAKIDLAWFPLYSYHELVVDMCRNDENVAILEARTKFTPKANS